MQQENQKGSVDTGHRRHKTEVSKKKRSDITSKIHAVEKKNATEHEKEAYDALINEGKPIYNDDTSIGTHIASRGKRKIVIVDEETELHRQKASRYSAFILIVFTVIAMIVSAIMLVNFFLSTDIGQEIAERLDGSPITKDGNYIFGSFDDRVTIGDSYDTAVDILGFPDTPDEQEDALYLYYGESYIIVDKNETVVGYYKAPHESFKVSVGDAKKDVNRMIFAGDSAQRVIDKLGSPDHYLKRKWMYYGIDIDYERTNGENGKTLTVIFNEKYEVTSFKLE